MVPSQALQGYVQSGHTGVTQAGMGDGSVKQVSSGVLLPTWVYAQLPADGQVLGPDWQ